MPRPLLGMVSSALKEKACIMTGRPGSPVPGLCFFQKPPRRVGRHAEDTHAAHTRLWESRLAGHADVLLTQEWPEDVLQRSPDDPRRV